MNRGGHSLGDDGGGDGGGSRSGGGRRRRRSSALSLLRLRRCRRRCCPLRLLRPLQLRPEGRVLCLEGLDDGGSGGFGARRERRERVLDLGAQHGILGGEQLFGCCRGRGVACRCFRRPLLLLLLLLRHGRERGLVIDEFEKKGDFVFW